MVYEDAFYHVSARGNERKAISLSHPDYENFLTYLAHPYTVLVGWIKRSGSTFWQRRFWEHLLRDEEDWRRHMDYIHYNPVKQGHVEKPGDWPHSSFPQALKNG